MSKIETNVVKPPIKFLDGEKEYVIFDTEWEAPLDGKISEVETYMSSNNGKDQEESIKDDLYKNAQLLWKEYIGILTDAKYNFFLNRPQYQFLMDLIKRKMEYDVNTVFFAIELTNLLNEMQNKNFKNDEEYLSFQVNATEITYIYHLISKHKVKGLSKSAYLFSEVLLKIGDISKVFNYYDTAGKNLSTEIQNWVMTFENGVDAESSEEEVIASEIVE